MRARLARRKFLMVGLSTAVLLAGSLLVAGCGPGPAPAGTAFPTESSSTVVTVPPASSESTSSTVGASTVESLFVSLAQASQPMTIFAPTFLPQGTVLAESWLPVLDSEDPGTYEGPPLANPKVLGTGADAEIQVIFQAGEGWLAILENFRGDLGDVKGIPVGTVEGNPAALYEVNGGELVEWSKQGLWYGVFGRGVARDDMVAVALGMQPASAEAP
jgi:hypothetical protein